MHFLSKILTTLVLPNGKAKAFTSYQLYHCPSDTYTQAEQMAILHNQGKDNWSIEEISKYPLSEVFLHDGELYYLIVIEVPMFDEKSHKDKPMKLSFIVTADNDKEARENFVGHMDGIEYTIKQIKETSIDTYIESK